MQLAIIGGGIAGMTSAIKLAEAGQEVTVYEQAEGPGLGHGMDIQAIRNYLTKTDEIQHFKELGIPFENANPIHHIKKYAPSGRSMNLYSHDKPLFYSFKRGPEKHSLDSQLHDLAEQRGVEFGFNQKKPLKGGDVIAINPIYKNIWAYGEVYDTPSTDPETIHFFMNNRYCPKGYTYIIPYVDQTVVASVTFEMGAQLPVLLEKFLSENKVAKELINGTKLVKKVTGATYSNVPLTAEVNGKYFVGAAAGFVDGARGFGVKYAIESAVLAAKAITEKTSYDTLWKNAFEKDLVEEMTRRILLEKMDNNGYEEFILQDKVEISEYEKVPKALQRKWRDIIGSWKLKEWQKKYDLKKLLI